MSDHKVVFGASMKRMACRVCREHHETHDFKPNPDWGPVCKPTPDALRRFEKAAWERLQEALEDFEHAAAKRKEMEGS